MSRKTFIEEVAEKLYRRYGNNISKLTIIFPSQRARLFFSEALSKLIERPIWQPNYMTMDDIMSEAADIKPCDKLFLITELYNIYKKHHTEETFDKFYFWGEILLSDFDLIDKYMIDADMLFCNLSDLKELEADTSYLTPEMIQIIQSFWSHFKTTPLSKEKEEFISIWQSLKPIYHSFKEQLSVIGQAYTGMIYRSAVENIAQGVSSPDCSRHYVFVGFNALSECERRVLKFLENNSECEFIWDYDTYYIENKNQEAGKFLRENLSSFKAIDDVTHDNFLNINKEIQAISCVSNVVQCKYVNTLLREIAAKQGSEKGEFKIDKETAIVLTDESLLMPLLHSLPAEIGDRINVTMGYPILQTTAYSFLERLLELQKSSRKSQEENNFYHVDACGLLSHPYIIEAIGEIAHKKRNEIIDGRMIRVKESFFKDNELLDKIFSLSSNYIELSKYLLEVFDYLAKSVIESDEKSLKLSYLSLIAEQISSLDNCIKSCNIELTIPIYTSLLRRHLQTLRIPFSGEPLQGLQVMGILETRNLDFKNVIILSMNDDNFPGNLTGATSFIPYNLKAAYGMPTPEHHEGVYAYYFYRLLQRAERVDMLYCSHADNKSTGEQSRYIHQLNYESPYQIKHLNVGVDVSTDEPTDITIEKRGKVAQALDKYLDENSKAKLAPTALSRYIACPMEFYFHYIAKIKEKDELSEDVDNRMFGNILHRAMEILYTGAEEKPKKIEEIFKIKDKDIELAVIEATNEEYLKKENCLSDKDFTGSLILIKDIIIKYIKNGVIPYDRRECNFSLRGLEEDIYDLFDLQDGRKVKLGGIADRIDMRSNGNLRVIDYKSGRPKLEFNGIETLFNGENRSQNKYAFQTMLYSMILHKKYGHNVEPALYFARDMHKPDYSPRLTDKSRESTQVEYKDYAEEFEGLLREKLQELFNYEIPFSRCEEEEAGSPCVYCDYKRICRRWKEKEY